MDLLKVFEQSIKHKDTMAFEGLKLQNSSLYTTLIEDFKINRVNRKNLIEYFRALFGDKMYKNNTTLIADLRELSNTKEPFENIKTFIKQRQVYYSLHENT